MNSPAEIDRLRRFGHQQHYNKPQPLFVTGEIAPGMFVLKRGRVQVTRRDPRGALPKQLGVHSLHLL